MGAERILVVDNDPQIRRVMRTTLIARGFEVNDARNGIEALERLQSEKYQLVLLDINMPGMTGFEVCQTLRGGDADVVIIMLTVRAAAKDATHAFEVGADDYVTKPFSTPELLARIDAALRRKARSSVQRDHLQLGDATIDFAARSVKNRNEENRLSPKEFALLSYLASHPNQIITHRELLQMVWGISSGDEREYLRVFINRLRKKIERSPDEPEYLITVPWVGYRLRLPT